MNCERARDLILLSASGEAGRRDVARLAAHVSSCAECKTYHDMGERIERATRTCAAFRQPSQTVVRTILAQARDTEKPSPATIFWRPLLSSAIGIAASLIVIAGLWFHYSGHAIYNKGILEANALVTLVGDRSDAQPGDAIAQGGDPEEALRTLGAKLLEWEGFTEEDTVADGEMVDEVTEWLKPPPTALRSRSTAASAAGIYG